MLNHSRVVTRAHIHEHVWPYGHAMNPRAVDVHICTLRRKLDRHGPPLVKTLYGIGYTLRASGAPAAVGGAAR
jgi:two-component system OmpR family response regulator